MKSFVGKFHRGHFTRSGMILIVVLFLLLLSAWNTGENLLYIVFSGVMGMFLLSLVSGRWTLHKISLERQLPYAVFRNSRFVYTARIINGKRFVPGLSLRLETKGSPSGYILRVPAGSDASIAVYHVFHKRGVYTMPPMELVTSFPFGFMEYRKVFLDDHEVLVYPGIAQVRTSALEQSLRSASVSRQFPGDGDEFFSIREYMPGDDYRFIAWRVSARLGKLMVREMGVGNSRTLVFLLDTRWGNSPDHEDAFEEMIDITASLMITLLGRQYSVGFVTPQIQVAPAKGSSQERRILDALARLTPFNEPVWPGYDLLSQRLLSEPIRVFLISRNTDFDQSLERNPGIAAIDLDGVVYG